VNTEQAETYFYSDIGRQSGHANLERLVLIQKKLAAHLNTYPLFDAARFKRNIERAFTLMPERHQVSLDPDHIEVTECQ